MAAAKPDLETLFERRREIDRELLETHSRPVAILFTDIVGSTRYFEEKGDIAGLELVKRHNDLLFPVVRAHQGWIVKTIGDAIMAVFEDGAQAARCAVAMQRALDEEGGGGKEPIQIRIGAHHGRALVDEGKDVYGDAVNTAARVVNQARGGEIILSASLAELLPEDFGEPLVPHGTFQPKGKAEPLALVKVQWRTSEPAPAVPASPEELFVLELHTGAKGLKVAALDGARDKGTIKAYAEVEVSPRKLGALAARFVTFTRGGGSTSYVHRVRDLGASLFETALSERARRLLRETRLRYLRIQLEDEWVHVPWELAWDGENFLALRFALGRTISARAEPSSGLASPGPEGAGQAHALVVSNPSGDLEAAVREGEAVAGLLRDGWRGEVRHVRGPVRKEDFLAALSGCAVLHFAGHADPPDQAQPGGFRLADGVVSPEEVARAVGARAPPLVFANSCHASTGSGFQEKGGADLASALLLRGARHFVGPRWEIADEDALTFALRFYEQALAGVPLGEAVRRARVALVAPGARPLSFAAYVLYGEPREALPAERIRLVPAAPTRSSPSSEEVPQVPALLPAQTAGAAARRSRWTAVGVGVAVAMAGAALAYRLTRPEAPAVPVAASGPQADGTGETAAPAPTGPVRLCVLPFKNLGGQEELEFLRHGLTEAVMTDFGMNKGIRLIERAQVDLEIEELEFSQSRYVDPRTRARLGLIKGAEVVVMGGFQRAGDLIRAHARFVHVETGEVLHAVKVDRTVKAGDGKALFDLQDEVAKKVRESVPEIVGRLR